MKCEPRVGCVKRYLPTVVCSHPKGAIASYTQAIALNPNYAEAYQNLGVVLLKLGNLQDSLSAFGKAIVLHEKYNPDEAKKLRHSLREMKLI